MPFEKNLVHMLLQFLYSYAKAGGLMLTANGSVV